MRRYDASAAYSTRYGHVRSEHFDAAAWRRLLPPRAARDEADAAASARANDEAQRRMTRLRCCKARRSKRYGVAMAAMPKTRSGTRGAFREKRRC